MIGFDDLLEARALRPPLTTVHNPAFTVGQQALRTMLDVIAGHPPEASSIHIPVRLIIRHSCGCRAGVDRVSTAAIRQPAADSSVALARAMAKAVLLETRIEPDEAEAMCDDLVEAFIAGVQAGDGAPFEEALLAVLRRAEALDDDAYAWHLALDVLRHRLTDLRPPLSASTRVSAEELLNWARQAVSERTQQQTAHALLREENLVIKLGQMTARLLAALDTSQIPPILAEHLPLLGIRQMLGARFVPDDDDPVALSERMLSYGLAGDTGQQRFITRRFPPPDLYPPDRSFQLALLPLVVQEVGSGFVVFDAANLEPCAAIVRNLAAALRGSHLYAEALHGRQQAEQANRLKSRFLSMVSHELRTPLNLIVGLSELLLRQQPSKPAVSDTSIRDLERIYTSAQHLGQLIGDVLDLASSEAGQLHLLREPLDLAEVLRVVATAGEHMAREQGLAWEARLPPRGPWVLGDRTRLRQVMLNLISNAVKFTSSGRVTLAAIIVPGETTVTVSDTGLGVPVAEQARIFDEFQRAERTTARGYGGLGLGLAICKQFVELHGGTIGVHSAGEEGSGATFFFTLPTMAEEPAASELTLAPPIEELS
ncbi:MAG TPA: ATP-binding protein [Roseiflexaceae bacterium]